MTWGMEVTCVLVVSITAIAFSTSLLRLGLPLAGYTPAGYTNCITFLACCQNTIGSG
jgi:hypothetical protein